MKTRYLYEKWRLTILILGVSLISIRCNTYDYQKLTHHNWKLVWSDDFNGPSGTLPDSTKWAFDIGTGNGGWGNQELEYYTKRTDNISLDGDGHLVITAKKESYSGAAFTSARINTKGLFEQKYGRVEARIKTPYGPGLWPAFWMLGSNIDNVGWPQTGEIDIMELRGQTPNIINGTIHGPGYSGGNAITKPYGLPNSRFDTDYHIFAVEWFPDRIDFFVDDFLYERITRADLKAKGKEWVFDKPFFILLNVAVGGTYVGFPNSKTPFPQKMYVDYVKVYTE